MPKKSEFHIIAITAIIVHRGKVLIAKRSEKEIAYPGMWTVPGGKFDISDFKNKRKTTKDAWYEVIEPTLAREVKEEVGIKIKDVKYLIDLAFIRPDGHSVLCLSYWCRYAGGRVKLSPDLIDFAWVKPIKSELGKYDIIEGIPEEIIEVGKILRRNKK